MPVADVTLATALATLVIGLYANYPFALAPGMGLNAYFTYSVVLEMGVSYPVALTAVFIEGLLFLLLTIAGVRTAVLNAIPSTLKIATMSGIGLFLAIIGFSNAGLVVPHADTLVTLSDPHNPNVLMALVGLALMSVLLVRKVPGALLIGILAATGLAWAIGLAPAPSRLFSLPTLPRETLAAFDFTPLLTGKLVTVVLAFLFVDFFDTAGTLMGVGQLGGFLDEESNLPRADRAFTADAVGIIAGAVLGTSTVTAYIESATGIEEGGRTGLTAVVVALLFLLSLFVLPLITAVPSVATAPALIVVGALMMQGTRDLPWQQLDEAIPAFLTITAMPFTYSIANGIALGIVAFVLVKSLSGRAREVHGLLYLLARCSSSITASWPETTSTLYFLRPSNDTKSSPDKPLNSMTPRQKEKQKLLTRVHQLMEEAFRLPRSTSSFGRREEIDWELVQLFRQIADLSAGPKPYWADDTWTEPADTIAPADDTDALSA